MALAVGIVLGSGPLKPAIDTALTTNYESLRKDREALRDENVALEKRAEYRDEALNALAPSLISGRLKGRRVVVVQAPDAEGDLVSAVTATLEQAGAGISGTVGITESYADRTKESELEALLDRLTPPRTTFPEEVTPQSRAGNAIGRALVTSNPRQGGADDASPALLAGLADLGFVTVDGEPARRASLAVIVLGPAPAESDDQARDRARRAAESLGELALGLDRQGSGAVVA
ncbi:MAG: copper transporter, partial [Actinomycetota bacterium]|nr:copper transporter [Actinomycetota bacterium]